MSCIDDNFFAEYLETIETISEEQKRQIQEWCSELFNQIFPYLVKQDF